LLYLFSDYISSLVRYVFIYVFSCYAFFDFFIYLVVRFVVSVFTYIVRYFCSSLVVFDYLVWFVMSSISLGIYVCMSFFIYVFIVLWL